MFAASALAITATLSSTTTAGANVQPHIVGGTGASGDTSWMVSLQYDAPKYGRFDYHTCGGSLIFRNWIITNAHCVTDEPHAKATPKKLTFNGVADQPIPTADKHFKVRVGSKNRTTGGETASVVQVVVHPNWHWGMTAPTDDIAMLKLDHRVQQQSIQLAGRDAQPGERVTLYGWGSDDPAGVPEDLPVTLQQLDTRVLPSYRCADAGQTDGEICTNNPHGTDGPGAGDSGGPAVRFENGVAQLVGSCSRGASQLPGEAPTVYTSSPDFRSWVYSTARGVKTP
ncbi:serine protease [Amycolatopsis sp. A1MSW2902]